MGRGVLPYLYIGIVRVGVFRQEEWREQERREFVLIYRINQGAGRNRERS